MRTTAEWEEFTKTYEREASSVIKEITEYAIYLDGVSAEWAKAKTDFEKEIAVFNSTTGSSLEFEDEPDILVQRVDEMEEGVTDVVASNNKSLKNNPYKEGSKYSVYDWITNTGISFKSHTAGVIGQGSVNMPTSPIFVAEMQPVETLIIYQITPPTIPVVSEWPEEPVQPENPEKPQEVTSVEEPENRPIEPTEPVSEEPIDVTGVELPALTERPIVPNQSVEAPNKVNPVTDIDSENQEATESTRPERPTDLDDFETSTTVDPIEKPAEIGKVPEISKPNQPNPAAPETIDRKPEKPIEEEIFFTAPSNPKKSEAPSSSKEPATPLLLTKPKDPDPTRPRLVNIQGTADTALLPTEELTGNTLPATRTRGVLPSTGTKMSMAIQYVGALMIEAIGLLVFWKRRANKKSEK